MCNERTFITGGIEPHQGETLCCWHHQSVPAHTGVCPWVHFFWVRRFFTFLQLYYYWKQTQIPLYFHGLPYVKALSLSVAFTQWSHFVLSDLGYRWTRGCAVAHQKAELPCGSDLRLWRKPLEGSAGFCHFCRLYYLLVIKYTWGLKQQHVYSLCRRLNKPAVPAGSVT